MSILDALFDRTVYAPLAPGEDPTQQQQKLDRYRGSGGLLRSPQFWIIAVSGALFAAYWFTKPANAKNNPPPAPTLAAIAEVAETLVPTLTTTPAPTEPTATPAAPTDHPPLDATPTPFEMYTVEPPTAVPTVVVEVTRLVPGPSVVQRVEVPVVQTVVRQIETTRVVEQTRVVIVTEIVYQIVTATFTPIPTATNTPMPPAEPAGTAGPYSVFLPVVVR